MLTKKETMNRIEKRANGLLERQKQAKLARSRARAVKTGVKPITNN